MLRYFTLILELVKTLELQVIFQAKIDVITIFFPLSSSNNFPIHASSMRFPTKHKFIGFSELQSQVNQAPEHHPFFNKCLQKPLV